MRQEVCLVLHQVDFVDEIFANVGTCIIGVGLLDRIQEDDGDMVGIVGLVEVVLVKDAQGGLGVGDSGRGCGGKEGSEGSCLVCHHIVDVFRVQRNGENEKGVLDAEEVDHFIVLHESIVIDLFLPHSRVPMCKVASTQASRARQNNRRTRGS